MKTKIFMLLVLILINSGCQMDDSAVANDAFEPNEDKACRETIQKLYSVETYCPDNLIALQSLFTDEFNSQNKLTLERCSEVNRYEVLALLSEDDPDFLDTPGNPKSPDLKEYLVKLNIISKSGNALDNSPSLVWLHVKIDGSNECRVNSIHGGG